MDKINMFISTFPISNFTSILSKVINNINKPYFNIILNKKTNVLSYTILDIDILYHFIVPFLNNLKFQSRKFIDYKYFVIIVYIHKLGYYMLPKGKELILAISLSINKNRYSTNPTVSIEPTQKSIEDVFNIEPPFDISKGDSHSKLSKIYTLANGGRKGYLVHVFKNGIEISNSPFSSYNSAQKAIGLSGRSRTINRYINTGRLYKNIYSFKS
jgi:hypothetical protein